MSANEYPDLPQVAGRTLDYSLAEFERRCRVLIKEEVADPNMDSATVSVLSDAVRLCREYADAMQRKGAER